VAKRVARAAARLVEQPKVIVGIGKVRICGESALVHLLGLSRSRQVFQHDAQVEAGNGIVGVEREGFSVVSLGFLQIAAPVQQLTEVDVGLGHCRVKSESLFVCGLCLVGRGRLQFRRQVVPLGRRETEAASR
jgi:hypothetical protein